jgi:hypothetical protein
MTLNKTRELLQAQVNFGGTYNGNSSEPILSEVQRKHGQAAVDKLIRDLNLEQIFDFKPGTRFRGNCHVGGFPAAISSK